MAGELKRYAFINAKLRARISLILADQEMERLIRAPSLPETVQLLHGTQFEFLETVYNQTGDIKMMELELLRAEVRLHREL